MGLLVDTCSKVQYYEQHAFYYGLNISFLAIESVSQVTVGLTSTWTVQQLQGAGQCHKTID